MEKTTVLFLCTGNSARSQMAEAFLRSYAADHFEVYSAGLEPKGINPLTRQVMLERGLDLGEQYSKHVDEYAGKVHFDTLVTVCAQADQNCPVALLKPGVRLHWFFDDPAAVPGTDAEKLASFRLVRDQIDRRVQDWLAEQGIPLERRALD